MKSVLSISVLLIAVGNVAYCQSVTSNVTHASDESKQMDKLFSRWDNSSSPGVAVAVVREGELIFKKGYGMANLEYEVPITPSTVFHIASVSKQFTAFAVLLLAEQGKLSLDDDIRKHIPEVPDFGTKITLRHLALHTSGMRDQWALLQMAGWRMDDVITKNHIMKLVANQRELNFEPGDRHLYCNTGYTLLAEVVARVSGQSFAEFTEDNIFEPLAMHNTLFFDDHEKIVPNRAYSYQPTEDGYRKSVLSYANVGATSLFTTAEDLAQWTVNFENPKVGSREMMDIMKTKGVLNNGTSMSYALGQVVGKYRGRVEIGHGGADAGFRSSLSRFPEQEFSVILLGNVGTLNLSSLKNQVVDIFLSKELQASKEAPGEEPPSTKKDDKSVTSTDEPIDPIQFKKFVGSYQIFPGLILQISQDQGQLYGQATGQPKSKLTPLSPTRFAVEQVGAKIDFSVDQDENVPELILKQGGRTFKCDRVIPFDTSSVDLDEFSGTFHSPELSTQYTFVVDDHKLVIRHSRHDDVEAVPIDKDLFAGGLILGNIKFIRDQDNSIISCKMSNGRVLNLRFEKQSK